MTMKWFLTAPALVLAASVAAKLPALSDEAKAKAAETAAKAAWTDKVAAYQLCQSQDRVAAKYFSDQKAAGKAASAAAATPPCTDPGAFVYTPAASAPPIEAAGAHSPAKTATAPPSTNTPAAALQPAKK
jgi:hypothetical protein